MSMLMDGEALKLRMTKLPPGVLRWWLDLGASKLDTACLVYKHKREWVYLEKDGAGGMKPSLQMTGALVDGREFDDGTMTVWDDRRGG